MSELPTNDQTSPTSQGTSGSAVDLITPYFRAKVMSAKPEELRMLLLDGAVRFARQAEEGLRNKKYEHSYNGITKCRDIIVELMTTIREDHNPELAKNVRALYTFIFNEITEANLERSALRMQKVVQLLEYERETWALLLEQLASGTRKSPPLGTDQPHKSISLSA